MTSRELAESLIRNNDLMVVSTANNDGKPWISPVGYIADGLNRLYWVSSKEAIHSENIRSRSEVAIVIVGENLEGNMDGVYFDALAEELEDETVLTEAVEIISKRSKDSKFDVNSIADVSGSAIWRVYRATPSKIWKRADTTQNGQAVTVREPIDI